MGDRADAVEIVVWALVGNVTLAPYMLVYKFLEPTGRSEVRCDEIALKADPTTSDVDGRWLSCVANNILNRI